VKKGKKTFLLLFILIFPSAFYVYLTAGKEKSFVRLPYYGPKHPFVLVEDGKKKNDTAFYSIPPFKYINQTGKEVKSTFLKGRIWVCCFEHLNDKNVSPSQAILMDRVEERTDRDSALRIITFALDSETATSLTDYATMVHASRRQLFLSGGTGQMEGFAKEDFYQPVDTSYKNGFIHFFLIDREGCIRGIYNGTHVKDIDALIDNISMLEAAYYVKANREEGKKDHHDDDESM
jgi:protein SCO1